jgi:ribosomal-protein-alanine N-acetyltransferase
MVSLTGISRGSMQSCMVGYFVDEQRAGRGLATGAVRDVLAVAFGELRLHRVEAGTAVANTASQRVLERNGFTLVGLLRKHLQIRGVWVDHLLWETLADDGSRPAA